MDIFEIERAVLRLKEMVNVKTDKDIAALLEMDVSAFNKRKKRNSFPERELLALATQRPELGIDVEYVLTGGSLSPHQRQSQDRAAAFTQALPASPEDKERLTALLHQAGKEMAVTNAQRDEDYKQITEVLRQCSDDTVALTLTLVVKLFRADLAERKKA